MHIADAGPLRERIQYEPDPVRSDRLVILVIEKFCEDDERAKSWAVQKALDKWLSERGY